MWPVFNLFRKMPEIGLEKSPREFIVDPDQITCPVPRVLWVELTSTCPFDCVFCTRKTRFGAGQHLNFEVYKAVIGELESPEFIGLNYSGESIYYPRLLEAVRLANATGASTELVTAFAPISKKLLEELVASGLDRLAISLHTLDPRQYLDVYRFGSLELLQERIDDFLSIKEKLGAKKPRLDFCFVALHENLGQLAAVAQYALQVGAAEIFIHPVIGRHPLPHDFSRELSANRLQESFKSNLRDAVASARAAAPGVPITILNPDVDPDPQLGYSPAYFAPPLPSGARIHTCDQSPFESVHILANRDVVICEVLDEVPLGNLGEHSLREIWDGERYREFRKKYVMAEISECCSCVWKMAYLPAPWKSAIGAADGRSPQLLRGWYLGGRETVIWSKGRSLLALRGAFQSRRVRVVGILPPALGRKANTLRVSCNKLLLGNITNPGDSVLGFDRTFRLSARGGTFIFEFVTEHTFRPATWSINTDQRDLGFALERMELLQ